MDKYGFVYIWFDRHSKRYYVGCHWGTVDDGYICSSKWMREAKKRRPNDFKRRIIKRIYTSRQELLEVENKYLSLIKDEELGKKYYNLTKHMNGHWTSDPDKLLTIGEKISKANKGKAKPPRSKEHQEKLANSIRGKPRSEETKKKISIKTKSLMTDERKQQLSIKTKSLMTDERKQQLSIANKGKSHPNKGIPMSEEQKIKIGETSKGRMVGRTHWNNGIKNKCCVECPGDGWSKGLITSRHS